MKKFNKVILAALFMAFILVSCNNANKSNTEVENTETTDAVETTVENDDDFSLDEITVTYVTSPLNVPSIVEKELKIFEETMPGVKVNYAEITSGADQTQALASGDVDVLYALGGSSAILAKANGVDVKVLNMYSRAPEAFGLYSNDETLTSAKSLEGKKIGGPAGTNLHELLVAYLDSEGMNIDDVEFLNMGIPDALAALENGSIDVAMLGGPAGYQALSSGKHLVTNGKGLIDAIICVATSEKFINEHPDIVAKIEEAQAKIQDYIKNNPEETKEIVMKELGLESQAYDDMVKYYNFSTDINQADKDGFARTAKFMKDTDMIENEIDIESLFR